MVRQHLPPPTWLAASLLLSALAVGCTRSQPRTPAPDAGAQSVAVFVGSDLRGYLGPCGCSENMRGGIARAAHVLAEARAQGPTVFFEAGDSLFHSQKLTDVTVPQEKRKAQALGEAFTQMGLVARGRGERDDALGDAFRTSLRLPELAPGDVKVVEVAGHKVAAAFAQDEAGMVAAAKKARAAGAELVVGLMHATFDVTQKAAANPALEADVLVVAHSAHENDGEESRLLRGRVPVAVVQSKGRALLRLDATFDGPPGRMAWVGSAADVERELAALDGRIELLRAEVNAPGLSDALRGLKKAKLEELMVRREQRASAPPPRTQGTRSLSARFVPLETSVPMEKVVEELVRVYDFDVAKLNLEYAKAHGQDCPKPAKGEAAFVGNNACRECHEETFPVWEASKHAHAYKSLEEKGKQYHLDCVRCHVVGMDRPGGVCRVDRVEGRKDVGCESCHGPGSLHSEDPTGDNIALGNTPADCVGCHDAENSPHFNFTTYLTQILGPGHGKASAAKQ